MILRIKLLTQDKRDVTRRSIGAFKKITIITVVTKYSV